MWRRELGTLRYLQTGRIPIDTIIRNHGKVPTSRKRAVRVGGPASEAESQAGDRTGENLILAAIPRKRYADFFAGLEAVSLGIGTIITEPDEAPQYVYFPVPGAMVSIVRILEDGRTSEVGVVGNEGMTGLHIILGETSQPNRVLIQAPGMGYRLPVLLLRQAFSQGDLFQQILLRYTNLFLTQVSQTAACNRLHTIDKRLSRWLLVTRDRVQSNALPITHEFISHMLGIRRAGVTNAVASLSRQGVISHVRGRITILDGKALEKMSCECYRALAGIYQQRLAG